MDKHLVSVIVPIYNTEKWLDVCIASIVSQSYPHWELILVDDGSTDACPQICDAWAKRDSRVRVIHKKNDGLGNARNSGIDAACGDYLCFVDSDDCLLPTAIEQALRCALESDAELVSFGCETISESEKYLHRLAPQREEIYRGSAVQNEFLPRLLRGENCCFSAWSLLYSTTLLRRHDWHFVSEREIISEDYYSLLELMAEVDSVAMLPQVLYQYRQRSESLSRKWDVQRFDRCRHCHEEMVALCKQKNYPQSVLKVVGIPFLNNSIAIMKQLVHSKQDPAELWRIFHDRELQAVVSHADCRRMSAAKRLFCCLLRHRCDRLCLLLLKLQCRKEKSHASSDS